MSKRQREEEPECAIDGLFYNTDCRSGAREHLPDGSVDLIVTDPPYGIDGDTLDKHYNRDESRVVAWIRRRGGPRLPGVQPRVGRRSRARAAPGGRVFVVSGYTRLPDVLGALEAAGLRAVSHIIWKFNFGVWTTQKFVSSHYHILLYEKPPSMPARSRLGPRRSAVMCGRFGASTTRARKKTGTNCQANCWRA
jgi:DNA modification methylase